MVIVAEPVGREHETVTLHFNGAKLESLGALMLGILTEPPRRKPYEGILPQSLEPRRSRGVLFSDWSECQLDS